MGKGKRKQEEDVDHAFQGKKKPTTPTARGSRSRSRSTTSTSQSSGRSSTSATPGSSKSESLLSSLTRSSNSDGSRRGSNRGSPLKSFNPAGNSEAQDEEMEEGDLGSPPISTEVETENQDESSETPTTFKELHTTEDDSDAMFSNVEARLTLKIQDSHAYVRFTLTGMVRKQNGEFGSKVRSVVETAADESRSDGKGHPLKDLELEEVVDPEELKRLLKKKEEEITSHVSGPGKALKARIPIRLFESLLKKSASKTKNIYFNVTDGCLRPFITGHMDNSDRMLGLQVKATTAPNELLEALPFAVSDSSHTRKINLHHYNHETMCYHSDPSRDEKLLSIARAFADIITTAKDKDWDKYECMLVSAWLRSELPDSVFPLGTGLRVDTYNIYSRRQVRSRRQVSIRLIHGKTSIGSITLSEDTETLKDVAVEHGEELKRGLEKGYHFYLGPYFGEVVEELGQKWEDQMRASCGLDNLKKISTRKVRKEKIENEMESFFKENLDQHSKFGCMICTEAYPLLSLDHFRCPECLEKYVDDEMFLRLKRRDGKAAQEHHEKYDAKRKSGQLTEKLTSSLVKKDSILPPLEIHPPLESLTTMESRAELIKPTTEEKRRILQAVEKVAPFVLGNQIEKLRSKGIGTEESFEDFRKSQTYQSKASGLRASFPSIDLSIPRNIEGLKNSHNETSTSLIPALLQKKRLTYDVSIGLTLSLGSLNSLQFEKISEQVKKNLKLVHGEVVKHQDSQFANLARRFAEQGVDIKSMGSSSKGKTIEDAKKVFNASESAWKDGKELKDDYDPESLGLSDDLLGFRTLPHSGRSTTSNQESGGTRLLGIFEELLKNYNLDDGEDFTKEKLKAIKLIKKELQFIDDGDWKCIALFEAVLEFINDSFEEFQNLFPDWDAEEIARFVIELVWISILFCDGVWIIEFICVISEKGKLDVILCFIIWLLKWYRANKSEDGKVYDEFTRIQLNFNQRRGKNPFHPAIAHQNHTFETGFASLQITGQDETLDVDGYENINATVQLNIVNFLIGSSPITSIAAALATVAPGLAGLLKNGFQSKLIGTSLSPVEQAEVCSLVEKHQFSYESLKFLEFNNLSGWSKIIYEL